MKRTVKSQILDYVESLDNDARYTDIVRFAHDCWYSDQDCAARDWLANPNRRGWFSNAFYGQWVYLEPDRKHFDYRVGYLVKRGVKSGWLEKKTNGRYKTVRPTNNSTRYGKHQTLFD